MAQWNIERLITNRVGSGDSVEVEKIYWSAFDSDGVYRAKRSGWILPERELVFSDSSELRLLSQDSSFDIMMEADSIILSGMHRVESDLRVDLDILRQNNQILLVDSASVDAI